MSNPASTENIFKTLSLEFKPILDASLDPVCIVDAENRIQYMNLAMKSLLKLRPAQAKSTPVFCDHLKLSACEKECQIIKSIRKGIPLRLDEAPAARESEKLRVLLRAVPIYGKTGKKDSAIGALLTVRDSTAEVILQAKYHKLLEIVREKEIEIADLKDQIKDQQALMRRSRSSL